MPNYAHATIIGHLGKDPEQRGDFVSASVAVTLKKGDKPTWWRVSCFKKDGEALMKLRKGESAHFSGTPYQSEWSDKDGVVKQTLELGFARVTFTASKGEGATKPQDADNSFHGRVGDDDLPF